MDKQDIYKLAMSVIYQYSETIVRRVKNTYNGFSLEGKAEIDFAAVIALDGVISRISAEGYKAQILEHGKGSLMDKNNPYLSEYMQSELWNPDRRDYDVTGRARGWYKNADGELVYSDGRAKGRSLERMRKPEFMPQEAMHIIETEIELTIPEIEEAIADVMAKGIADMIAGELKSIRIEV